MELQPIVPEDYLKLSKVGEIVASKKLVAWVQTFPSPTEKSYTSHIRLLKNGEIRQITSGKKQDYSPKFSPDGKKLLFISTRNDKPQAFLLDLEFGGEAQQITNHPNGISEVAWCPNGKRIAFTARINEEEAGKEYEEKEPPKNKFDVERKKLEEEEKKDRMFDPYVTDELVYREGTSYHDKRKSHIYIQNLGEKHATRITERWTNHAAIEWLDENTIVAYAKTDIPPDLSKEVTVLKFDVSNPVMQKGKELAKFMGYFGMQLEASPDGKFVVTTKIAGETLAGGILVPVIIDMDTGKQRVILEDIDRDITNFKWISPSEIYFTVEDRGTMDLRKINLENNQVETIYRGENSILQWDRNDEGYFFTATSVRHPWAVWKQADELSLLEDPNEEYLKSHKIVEPEEIWFESPHGGKFQGWFFPPANNEKKPPLALHLHGGPHVMWTPAGTMWHEFQCFAAKGYAVLATNPHGSSGYGRDFTTSIVGEWGEKDYLDIQKALESISDRYDPDKMFVLGGSYAGFQTANVISRDKRFKAAVAQRGVYDNISFTLTTDIPLWFMDELVGNPWDEHEKFWKLSPLSRAREIETPLLIIAATNDFRVPISQSEELFAALRLQNKETMFVRYPRDGHELSRSGEPLHVVDRLKRMIQWFEDHK